MLDKFLQLGRVLLLVGQGVLEAEAQTGLSGPVVGREIDLGLSNGLCSESHNEVKLARRNLSDARCPTNLVLCRCREWVVDLQRLQILLFTSEPRVALAE